MMVVSPAHMGSETVEGGSWAMVVGLGSGDGTLVSGFDRSRSEVLDTPSVDGLLDTALPGVARGEGFVGFVSGLAFSAVCFPDSSVSGLLDD